MSKGTRMTSAASLLGIPLLLLLAIACEDSAVVAPSDGSITVTLNPTSVTVDPSTEKSSDVRAILLDKTGRPVENAVVYFSSTGGRLVRPGSNPPAAMDSANTDSQGIARATLLVSADDPDDVDVTALSGALTDTATLSKSLVGEQRPPTAQFTIEPCGTPCVGGVGDIITFKSTSTDPNDGDVLTYRWNIDSTVNGEDIIDRVTQATRFSETYQAAQDLVVRLEVSDDPNAFTSPGTVVWDDEVSKSYKICANRAPVADAQATVGSTRSVPVSGSGSSDPDGDPLTFAWQCGNGSTATGEDAVCTYLTAGTFTITLTVTDAPSGCPSRSATDTTVVTVP